MSNLRFALVTVGLFLAAFVGISWASKGFPVMAMRLVPMKPDARIPTFQESVQQGLRRDWENSKTAQGDGHPKRTALRLAALQAANGYALSPCDKTMKQNLIEALSAYASAWSEMAGCRFSFCTGNKSKVDNAAAAFSTPADMRVREALRDAFDKGGVSRSDFPSSIRLQVMILVGHPGDPVSACDPRRRAENFR